MLHRKRKGSSRRSIRFSLKQLIPKKGGERKWRKLLNSYLMLLGCLLHFQNEEAQKEDNGAADGDHEQLQGVHRNGVGVGIVIDRASRSLIEQEDI